MDLNREGNEKASGISTYSGNLLKTNPKQIPKVSTGISSLDEVLHGGFPENRTTLIKGAAGTGKTILGLEFLYHSARNGEPVVFISFEESAEAIRQNAFALGWDLSALEETGMFFLWEAKIDRSAITSGAFSIDALLAAIQGKAEQLGARRIMIDAIDVLLRIFEDPIKEQNELYRLHDWLVEQQFTAVLTAKIAHQAESGFSYEFLDYLADCVLLLDLRISSQVATRRLRVLKYRGASFYSNEYPYLITTEGNIIFPITGLHLIHQPLGEKITSGNAIFDKQLGGGYYQGSAIVISGPSGSGKTTLAATFAETVCSQGGKILYISFEESPESIVSTMRSPGIDLQPVIAKGNLRFYTIFPEALIPEEHLYRILQQIEQYQPDHIVVDAISACRRMGTEEAAFDFLVRLIYTCKQRNITCLMTNQITGNGSGWTTATAIASLVDTLILLNFLDVDHQIQRDLVIIKSRGAHHSNWHHRYMITNNGIRIDPLETEA